MILFATGFLAGWALAILLYQRPPGADVMNALRPAEPKGNGNPPLCQHCGCAHPLGDEVWRKLDADHAHINQKMDKWKEPASGRYVDDPYYKDQNPASYPGLRT